MHQNHKSEKKLARTKMRNFVMHQNRKSEEKKWQELKCEIS